MLYNQNNFPRYVATAGKVTVLTVLSAIAVFVAAFIINFGQAELQKVEAQSGVATTSLTVLNTPPQWVVGEEAREEFSSSTTTPTNSFSQISWVGRAIDSNGAPYFLIVCSTNATPTAMMSGGTLGTAPPVCNGGVQWGVSTSTLSGQTARVATTTIESAPFSESNVWYAWVCDDDPVNPRCSTSFSQGTNATNTSPFNVNRRPVFTTFSNNSPADPGQTFTFSSTSTDPDSVDTEDRIYLMVCSANTYSTTTNTCNPGDVIATTTINVFADAAATYTLPAIIQDTSYNAFGFIYDEHGHEANGGAHGTNVPFTVRNVAPTVAGGDITLNGGLDMILSVPGGETTGFSLNFTVSDANSCDAVGGGTADEVVNYRTSVFRSGVGTTTCDGSSSSYNPNSCYANGVGASVWGLNCTASTTSCGGATDATVQYSCTFPLWFVADPTDGGINDTPFFAQDWRAGIAGIDDDNATGTMATSSIGVEVNSLIALDMVNALIAYSQLEPGTNMPSLTASSSLRVLGNTGLNQLIGGDSMCGAYTPSSPCLVSATSTIPQDQQRYGTSTIAYGTGSQLQPTSTPALLDIRIPKPTSTSTPTVGVTYWGIAVPASISLAGSYTGQNTFLGDNSAPANW